MKVKRIVKLTRPNTLIEYTQNQYFEDGNNIVGTTINDKYIITGKILSYNEVHSEDGLSMQHELIFVSEEDMIAFENESIWYCDERTERKAYQAQNNITSTVEYHNIPDNPIPM
jgi:hypothetical protein